MLACQSSAFRRTGRVFWSVHTSTVSYERCAGASVGRREAAGPHATGSLKNSLGVCQQTLSMVALSSPISFIASMTRGTMK